MHDVSLTESFTGSAHLHAPHGSVAATIRDAERLPLWNPALSRVSAPDHSGVSTVTVHHVLRGRLSITVVDPSVLAMTVTVPGLTEQSTWQVDHCTDPGCPRPCTVVHHTLRQRGPLADLIGPREIRRLPDLRLARLARHLRTTR